MPIGPVLVLNIESDPVQEFVQVKELPGLSIMRHFQYDFAVLGGAQGTIPFTDADDLSALADNFIVTNAFLDVITPLGSAGAATAALTSGEGAGDLVTATLVAGAPWSSAGLKATSVTGAFATYIKMTANRAPALVVAIANLNAGKFNLFIEGVQSE